MLEKSLFWLENSAISLIDRLLSLPQVELQHYVYLAMSLFFIAMLGIFIHRYNLLNLLLMVELMLMSVNIILVSASSFYGNIEGQILALMVMVVAAAEVAVGLAIFLLYFRRTGNIDAAGLLRVKG